MRNSVLLSIIGFIVFVSACQRGKRYRTESGLVYTLYSDEKDSIARMGSTAKIHFVQQAGDSVIDNTYDRMPLYYMVMPGYGNQYNPLEVFDYGLRVGDSVVTVQVVDSMVFKRILDSIPKWMAPGDQWTTRFKVLEVFTSDSALQADKIKEAERVMKLQTHLGLQRIQKYLDEQGIQTAQLKDSLYVQTVKKGSGSIPKSDDKIKLDYSLVSLGGKKLMGTRDTTSQEPAVFILGSGFMPSVLENELLQMPLGSSFKLYIPGVLLFGVQPQSKDVKIDDDWIVTMETYSY